MTQTTIYIFLKIINYLCNFNRCTEF